MTTLRLHLTGIAHGGEALGRHQGRVIFVPGALPGEEVLVELVKEKKKWARARLVEVLTPAPERVAPQCPFFGECGGCQWQYVAYPAQLTYKQSIVRDQLARLGHLPDALVHPTIPSPDPWRYRNHVRFSLSPAGEPGFRAAASRQVVPVDDCLLMHPLLQELFLALELDLAGFPLEYLGLRAGVNTGDQMVVFEVVEEVAPELEVDLPVSCVLLLGDGTPVNLIGFNYLLEKVAGRTYRISAGSFFQVNTPQAERLLEVVGEYLEPHPNDTLLDAYCGVGLFSIGLAERVGRVIGVEGYPHAVIDAQANAEGMDHVTFIEGAVEEVLPGLGEQVDLAIVDPPRTGCTRPVIEALAALGPRRIAYVSCDPAILARDAQALVETGYHLAEVQPVDMFPQTYHVESVALWVKEAHSVAIPSAGNSL